MFAKNVQMFAKIANCRQMSAKCFQISQKVRKMFAKGPLPEWKETEEMGFNKQASYLKNIAYGFIGIAVLGFFALLSSLLMKDK